MRPLKANSDFRIDFLGVQNIVHSPNVPVNNVPLGGSIHFPAARLCTISRVFYTKLPSKFPLDLGYIYFGLRHPPRRGRIDSLVPRQRSLTGGASRREQAGHRRCPGQVVRRTRTPSASPSLACNWVNSVPLALKSFGDRGASLQHEAKHRIFCRSR